VAIKCRKKHVILLSLWTPMIINV